LKNVQHPLTCGRLNNDIETLSSDLGLSPYQPHITLASFTFPSAVNSESILNNVISSYEEQVISHSVIFSLNGYKLVSHPVDSQKAIVLLVKLTSALSDIQTKTQDFIDSASPVCNVLDSPFIPHLSFIHDTKNSLSGLQRDYIITHKLTRDKYFHYEFEIDRLWLMDTSHLADHEQWICIKKWSFPNSAYNTSSIIMKPLPSLNVENLGLSYHEPFLQLCCRLAEQSVAHGNHPFGACLVLDGYVQLTAENSVFVPVKDVTRHAELNLISASTQQLTPEELSRAILYTSCEPCMMCCGAIVWSGINFIVYAMSHEMLSKYAGGSGLKSARSCLMTSCNRSFTIIGPILEMEASKIHKTFWTDNSQTDSTL
ncbi:unnamed protein product, partial [Didymodactylos carnosus]